MGSIQRRGMFLLHLGDAKNRMQQRGHHSHNRRSQPQRRSAHRGSSPAYLSPSWDAARGRGHVSAPLWQGAATARVPLGGT
jgi:hypothetical protein